MANNLIKIIFEAIDKATGVINNITGATNNLDKTTKQVGATASITSLSFTELNSAIMIAEQVIRAAGEVYDATVGKYQSYADQIDEIGNITGDSAENTSRLIQVMKLYGVQTDQLTTAQRKLATQGKSLSQDTLISLATEYQNLTNGQDRQLFLTENLGRAGKEWGEVLNQNTDSLKKQFDTVANGLILTEAQLAQADALEVSQIQTKNNWDMIGLAIGKYFAGDVLTATRALNIEIAAAQIASEQNLNLFTQHKKIYDLAYLQVAASERNAIAMKNETEVANELAGALLAVREYSSRGTIYDKTYQLAPGTSRGSIYDQLPGRASGGSVYAGQAYLVGERGPEPFIPSTNGTIIPNNQMSGGSNKELLAAIQALPRTITRALRQLEKYG